MKPIHVSGSAPCPSPVLTSASASAGCKAQGTLSQSAICHCDKHLSEPAPFLNWGGFLLVLGFKGFNSGQMVPLFWSGTPLVAKGKSNPNISFKATPSMISLPPSSKRFHHSPMVPQAGNWAHNPWGLPDIDNLLASLTQLLSCRPRAP